MLLRDKHGKLPRVGSRPNFLGIGMSKSGTTWLDSMLRQHPRVWMPPVKELHFFNDYFGFVAKGESSRYFCREPYSRNRWRRYLRDETKRALRFPSPGNIHWAFRFLFGRRDLDHYEGLFDRAGDRVSGEITPEYSVLQAAEICQIAQRWPEMKVILLLRNPCERAWSHAKMELAGRPGRELADVPPAEIEHFLFQDLGVRARSNYSTIIRNWESAVGRDRLFVGLYDDLRDDPRALLGRVCRFLGLDPAPLASLDAGEVVFQGIQGAMPAELKERLSQLLTPEIQFTADFLGQPDLVKKWSAWG